MHAVHRSSSARRRQSRLALGSPHPSLHPIQPIPSHPSLPVPSSPAAPRPSLVSTLEHARSQLNGVRGTKHVALNTLPLSCAIWQVGAAAIWQVRCVSGCDLPAPLHTSESLFLDDYEINYKLAVHANTVPVPPGRLNDLLRLVGMGKLSSTTTSSTKSEIEPILAHDAQESMAEARQRDVILNADEPEPCIKTDTAWDHGRLHAITLDPIPSHLIASHPIPKSHLIGSDPNQSHPVRSHLL